jgi:hypothetical protein
MKYLLASLIVVFVSSCVSNSNEFPLRELKSNDRMYVGQVNVVVNGQPGDKCELFLNSDLTANFKLVDSGWVIYKTQREESRFSRVTCKFKASPYVTAWITQSLGLDDLKRPKHFKTIANFGEILVNWNVDAKEVEKLVRSTTESKGPYLDGKVVGVGELTVEVKPNFEKAKAYYVETNKNEKMSDYEWVETLVELK